MRRLYLLSTSVPFLVGLVAIALQPPAVAASFAGNCVARRVTYYDGNQGPLVGYEYSDSQTGEQYFDPSPQDRDNPPNDTQRRAYMPASCRNENNTNDGSQFGGGAANDPFR